MIATHTIQNISFTKDFINLVIDGKPLSIALDKLSARLKEADDFKRSFFKISPSGYGIHWPLIDEDLSVEAILKIKAH